MKTKRTVIVAAVFVLLALGVLGYLHFFQSRPIGDGPAGPVVPSQKFGYRWSEKQILLVGLGDSVTAGFGARRGYSYFNRLVANPSDDFPDMNRLCLRAVLPRLQSTNLAISGTTSGEHIARELPLLPTAESNVMGLVVITTGGNDLIHNYGRTAPCEEAMYGATWDQALPWITNFEARVETIIEQVNRRFPGGCHIFLASIFDPTDGVGDIQRAGLPPWNDGMRILEAYNAVLRRRCESHSFVHFVDIHAAFLGHGLHCTQFWSAHYDSKDPHYWYYENLEDPNERGYDAMRRLFLFKIAEIENQLR
jgi:lysophospholipase L1-like esterase